MWWNHIYIYIVLVLELLRLKYERKISRDRKWGRWKKLMPPSPRQTLQRSMQKKEKKKKLQQLQYYNGGITWWLISCAVPGIRFELSCEMILELSRVNHDHLLFNFMCQRVEMIQLNLTGIFFKKKVQIQFFFFFPGGRDSRTCSSQVGGD